MAFACISMTQDQFLGNYHTDIVVLQYKVMLKLLWFWSCFVWKVVKSLWQTQIKMQFLMRSKKDRSTVLLSKKKLLPMQKRTEIDLLLADFKLMKGELENGGETKAAIKGLITTKKGKERSRLTSDDRKPLKTELEEVLLEWIESKWSCGLYVSLQTYHEEGRSCLWWFVKRHGEHGQRFQGIKGLARRLVAKVQRLQEKQSNTLWNIMAMDETPVCCNMVSETTIDATGKE